MHVGDTELVPVDPWAWHVMYSEKIGASTDRVTIEVYNAMDYFKGPDKVGVLPRRHPEHDGKVFDTVEEAAAYLIEHKLLRPRRPEDRDRSGPHIKTMKDRDDVEGFREYQEFTKALRIAILRGDPIR